MKKIVLIIAATFTLVTSFNAQVVIDTVSIGAGYSTDKWYSLQNDEQGASPQNNWDLAFDVSGFGTSIHINSVSGVSLWAYPNSDISGWSTVDTTGITTWESIYNSDTSWTIGAFDKNVSSNPFDIGWGIYNVNNHIITGDSLFIIKLTDGSYRKLWIENLSAGAFNFKYADIDGGNEQVTALTKSNFTDKLFGYYSLVNNMEMDREPVISSNWDLIFTRQTTFIPTPYNVTTVLSNSGVEVSQVENIGDVTNYGDWSSQTFATEINIIGSDWKFFNGTGYEVEDSLLYFVKSKSGDIWKLVFTGFGGSSTGNFIFSKEKISMAGIKDFSTNELTSFSAYPNPSNGNDITIIYDLPSSFKIGETKVYNLSGEQVYSQKINATQGLHTQKLFDMNLTSGVYIVSIELDNNQIQQKLVVQ